MPAAKPQMPPASSADSAAKRTVEKRLRKGRLDMQWSLDQVADTLKIRKDYLKAIEADDYKSLPEQIYATGFVRAYAKLVGLEPSQIAQEFSQAYQAVIQPPPEEPSLQVIVPTHKPQNRILFISLFILTIIVVIWLGASHERTQDLFLEVSHRVKQFIVPSQSITSSSDMVVEVPSALEEPFFTMPPETNEAPIQ